MYNAIFIFFLHLENYVISILAEIYMHVKSEMAIDFLSLIIYYILLLYFYRYLVKYQ